jgi:hypothetical protein
MSDGSIAISPPSIFVHCRGQGSVQRHHWPMMNHEPSSLQRRTLLSGFAALAANAVIGSNQVMAAIEQNTLKRRGVGLVAADPERAYPEFTLFAPLFVESRNVYLVDHRGNIVHTWEMLLAGSVRISHWTRNIILQWTHSGEQLSQSLPVQRWCGFGSGLEWQGALGSTPSGPSSSRHTAAQRERAAELYGQGTRRNRPARQRRDGRKQHAIGPICLSAKRRSRPDVL